MTTNQAITINQAIRLQVRKLTGLKFTYKQQKESLQAIKNYYHTSHSIWQTVKIKPEDAGVLAPICKNITLEVRFLLHYYSFSGNPVISLMIYYRHDNNIGQNSHTVTYRGCWDSLENKYVFE